MLRREVVWVAADWGSRRQHDKERKSVGTSTRTASAEAARFGSLVRDDSDGGSRRQCDTCGHGERQNLVTAKPLNGARIERRRLK